MVSPRAPRVFNLFEVLGVALPGITVLTGVLVILPNPLLPSSVWEYLGLAVVAFSLGQGVQVYSSKVGELDIFEKTMADVKIVPGNEEEDDSVPDSETDSSGVEFPTGVSEQPRGTESETSDRCGPTDDRSRSFRDRIKHNIVNYVNIIKSFLFQTGDKINIYVLYPLFAPLIVPFIRITQRFEWSPDVSGLNQIRQAYIAWKQAQRTYGFNSNFDAFEDFQQIVSSRVDDPSSPTRSYRFQAIRNFHRGMWLAVWLPWTLLFSYQIGSLLTGFKNVSWLPNGLIPDLGMLYSIPFCHGNPDCTPFLVQKGVGLIVAVGAILTIIGFWGMTLYFERLFIRYLITDYAVTKVNQDNDGG